MALGVGLGGWGIFGALWHIANHAVCKPLAFFSAGRLGQVYGSHHMTLIRGSLRRSPVWGIGLLGALMAITGMAPFGLFMSEWVIAKAAVQHHAWWPLAVFLAGCSIVFIGIMRQAIAMAWGEPATPVEPEPPARLMEWLVVAGMLAALLGLGLWLPDSVRLLMMKAARIVGAGI